MNKGTLRDLIKSVSHLTAQGCHIEARIKIAVAFNMFDEARILNCMDLIQATEKHLPRALETYRATVTDRLLRHIRESEGALVSEKVLRSLAIKSN